MQVLIMRQHMKQIPQLLLFIGIQFGLVFADTQTDIDDFKAEKAVLLQEMKKLDIRIAQTDSLAKDEAKRFETTRTRQREDLERRKAELDSMQVKIALVAKEVQAEKNIQGTYSVQVDNAKSFRAGIAKSLALKCVDLEAIVAQSLPWDREPRLERIRALRRDLENGNAAPEEGLTRLQSLYTEEIRFGDEVTIHNRPMIRNDGETVNARILRMGNQWIIYTDEEESKYGVLIRKTGKKGTIEYSWREDLSFEERAAVKLAIDVKLARKPPQMVRLPLSLTLEGK